MNRRALLKTIVGTAAAVVIPDEEVLRRFWPGFGPGAAHAAAGSSLEAALRQMANGPVAAPATVPPPPGLIISTLTFTWGRSPFDLAFAEITRPREPWRDVVLAQARTLEERARRGEVAPFSIGHASTLESAWRGPAEPDREIPADEYWTAHDSPSLLVRSLVVPHG